jgi:hypothetical protein
MIIRSMRTACWIAKATNKHVGCVILIAFPLQQWLHERSSMLRYTYIDCIVYFEILQTCFVVNLMLRISRATKLHM